MSSTVVGSEQSAQSVVGGPLSRLKGLVLLAGSVRATKLSASIGRNVLELPIDQERTVLGQWAEQGAALAEATGIERLPVMVLLDRTAPEVKPASCGSRVAMTVRRDSLEYRGTAGLVRDIAIEQSCDDFLLVANAAQVLLEPLVDLARALAAPGADVTMLASGEGMPGGVELIRCGAMSVVPGTGYVDMKEQALPEIARRHNVRVVRRAKPSSVPMRSLKDYIAALRAHHAAPDAHGSFAEAWQPKFKIIEGGAAVEEGAQLLDAVVLRGGRVGRGAIVARTVVCPGGVVAPSARAIDAVVSATPQARLAGLL